MSRSSSNPQKLPQTLKEVELPRRIRAAGGASLKEAGDFFGWQPSKITKTAADFTRGQLLAKGWTKQRLLHVAEGYEHIARITPNNQSADGRRSSATLPNCSTEEKHMAQHNHFVIRNDFTKPLILNIEPEGAFFSLDAGEEVSINDVFTATPVTVALAHSDTGPPIISIWPGDGQVRVEKNGADVLDLIQNGVARH